MIHADQKGGGCPMVDPDRGRDEAPRPRRSGAITVRKGASGAMIITVLPCSPERELRFTQLARALPGVSHRMLSQELKRLTRDGLVHRRVEESVPPTVFYRLTPLGISLHEPISVLREWAEAHIGEIDVARENSLRRYCHFLFHGRWRANGRPLTMSVRDTAGSLRPMEITGAPPAR